MNYWYLQVAAPSIEALQDTLQILGIRHGSCIYSQPGYEVGDWIAVQSAQHAAGKLTSVGYPARVMSRRSKYHDDDVAWSHDCGREG